MCVCYIPSKSLHLGNLQVFILWDIRRLCYAASHLPWWRVVSVYLKKIWGDSCNDRRARGPGRRLFRSGPSHAMLRARGWMAFWVTEFGGEGWARSWETLFVGVEDGGGLSVLLWRLRNGYRTQHQSGQRKPLW